MAGPKWVIGWCFANLPWRAASNEYKGMREWTSSVGDGNDVTGQSGLAEGTLRDVKSHGV